MTKSQIRLESKNMGLATWNIPSQSCLATRIPYNEIITVEKLRQIEACEEFLNQLGFYGIRVRHTPTRLKTAINQRLITLIQPE